MNPVLKKRDGVLAKISANIMYKLTMEMRNSQIFYSAECFPSDTILFAVEKSNHFIGDKAIKNAISYDCKQHVPVPSRPSWGCQYSGGGKTFFFRRPASSSGEPPAKKGDVGFKVFSTSCQEGEVEEILKFPYLPLSCRFLWFCGALPVHTL